MSRPASSLAVAATSSCGSARTAATTSEVREVAALDGSPASSFIDRRSAALRAATPRHGAVVALDTKDRGGAFHLGGQSGPTSPAFEAFPDFSLLNSGKHNKSKANTFSTPSKLSSKATEASSLGPRDILDTCELTFAKNLRDLQGSLLTELKADIYEALRPLKDELAGTVADARGATAFQEIIARLRCLEVPAVDIAPVVQQVSRVADAQLASAGRLEGLVFGEIAALKQVMQSSHAQHVDVDSSRSRRVADLEDAVCKVQSQLAEVLQHQEALCRSSSETSRQVQAIQGASKSHSEQFLMSLDRRLDERERSLKAQLEQPMMKIGAMHQDMSSNVRTVLHEIGKVQKAMNIDFMSVLDSRLSEVYIGVQHGMEHMTSKLDKAHHSIVASQAEFTSAKRYRDIWAQTDFVDTQEVWCQTDPSREALGRASMSKGHRRKSVVKRGQVQAMKSPVFNDVESMRQKARQALIQPQYDVASYYHEKGFAQAVAVHPYFDVTTLVVIVLNAIWIGVDTELNKADILNDADATFQIVEHTFCTYFVLELLTRFLAFNGKLNCFRDFWFMFDSVLVLLMVIETWIISIAIAVGGSKVGVALNHGSILRVVRMVKMFRVSRMARLLRSVPELVIIIKGVKAASRSVLVFFTLWLIMIYIFALIFTQLARGSESIYFNSLPTAMNNLLLHGILPDHAGIVNISASENWLFWPLLIIFICLGVLTLMNMLVGVLVEVVGAIAVMEKESVVVSGLANDMRHCMDIYGVDSQVGMSQKQFVEFLVEPEVTRIISGVGVDIIMLAEMSETIFDDLARERGEAILGFEPFVELILNLRGNNPAKVKDVKEQLRHIKSVLGESLEGMSKKVLSELRHGGKLSSMGSMDEMIFGNVVHMDRTGSRMSQESETAQRG